MIYQAIHKMVFLLLVGACSIAGAQAQYEPVEARELDQQTLREWRSEDQYQYGREPLPERRKREDEAPNESLSKTKQPNNPEMDLRVLWYGLIGIAFLVLIFWLLSRYMDWGKAEKIGGEVPLHELDLRPGNYQLLIQRAEAQEDWREAIRLHYGWALQLLEEKGKIRRLVHKTNADYIQDLARTALQSPFIQLSLSFDYIWYGFMPINEAEYQSEKGAFTQFIQQLS